MKLRLLIIAVILFSSVSYGQPVSGGQAATTAAPTASGPDWWKHAVLYEIYPRSFQDSNGDGVGDLNGITARLGYLEHLGVDAIWISPMYPSPQVDFGYDISNYEAVDPQYGTLADFDRMMATAREHHIRIILDMVLNHTSDKHPWFAEAASSRTSPKHDWYCWNDGVSADAPGVTDYQRRFVQNGPKGKVVPPNNWVSLFGGSAWEWVPALHQFYYHKFYKQQPDLNWRNPEVEKAMFAAMRFWMDRGVAGFRLDAIPTLFEDPQMRSEPVARAGVNAQGDPILNDIYTNMLPEVHDVLRRMRAMADTYSASTYPNTRVLIGETYLPNTAALLPWYGTPAHPELELPMDMLVGFHAEGGISGANANLSAQHFRETLNAAETEIDSHQPLLVFDNHDNPRSWDRFGDGVHNLAIAKIIASMLLTARATPLMYYGEEIGMVTSTPTRREDVKDPIGITGWPKEKGRDGERTPMQWDASNTQAGFSSAAHTWLPVPPDYPSVNVATESADPNSLLNWYSNLIRLRREVPALRDGSMRMLECHNVAVVCYVRKSSGNSAAAVVALNMSAAVQTAVLDLSAEAVAAPDAQTLLTDEKELSGTQHLASLPLAPFASWIGSVK